MVFMIYVLVNPLLRMYDAKYFTRAHPPEESSSFIMVLSSDCEFERADEQAGKPKITKFYSKNKT
jgi:hypothetical protein